MSQNEFYVIPENQNGIYDPDVPRFLLAEGDSFRQSPLRESPEAQVYDNIHQRLMSGAEKRILHAAGIGDDLPHIQFPNAEHIQHYGFFENDWENFGNLESAHFRLEFMLSKYPERRLPETMDSYLKAKINLDKSILQQWHNLTAHQNSRPSELDFLRTDIYHGILSDHYNRRAKEEYSNGTRGTTFVNPQNYPHTEDYSFELALWQKAQQEIVLDLDKPEPDFSSIEQFIDLYHFIKNPITQITGFEKRQAIIFQELFGSVRGHFLSTDTSLTQKIAIAVQIAHESSMIAHAEYIDVQSIGYGQLHEMPYLWVDIKQLPRGEFANPSEVLIKVREIIDDAKTYGHPVLTPIAVSLVQEPMQDVSLFIVDGNNRSSAVLLLSYLNKINFDYGKILDEKSIRKFVDENNLDIEWERDLVFALKKAEMDYDLLGYISNNQNIVSEISQMKIPALLTSEPDYITVDVTASSAQNKVKVLQPVHQAVYNNRTFSMAIPSKAQSHGRNSDNNRLLALRY